MLAALPRPEPRVDALPVSSLSSVLCLEGFPPVAAAAEVALVGWVEHEKGEADGDGFGGERL